ncbi:MAG TPA: hypothetical protein VK784_14430 [Pseudonocardiaceae bacterium]|jgi:hypothetical protein|nr:hypothetical protein [Pseudonocardiaceae bacterium]
MTVAGHGRIQHAHLSDPRRLVELAATTSPNPDPAVWPWCAVATPPWSMPRCAMASLIVSGVVLVLPFRPQIRQRHRVVSIVAMASHQTS